MLKLSTLAGRCGALRLSLVQAATMASGTCQLFLLLHCFLQNSQVSSSRDDQGRESRREEERRSYNTESAEGIQRSL